MCFHRSIGSIAARRLLALLGCCLLAFTAPGQSNEADLAVPSTPAATNAADEALKVMAVQMQILTELQTQQQAALKDLQQARREIAASLVEISSNNVAQLAAVSEMIVVQRKQDLKAVRDAQRIGLAIVVGMSGLLVLSILVLNLTSIRAINRMTMMLSTSAFLPASEAQALADVRAAQKRQLSLFPGEPPESPLGDSLLQLQNRIQDLERLAGKGHPVTQPPDFKASGATPAKAGDIPATSAAR